MEKRGAQIDVASGRLGAEEVGILEGAGGALNAALTSEMDVHVCQTSSDG